MVFLNRIYTKTGDQGESSLGDGTRVSKTHPRIIAYGSVDELNAVIGVALANQVPDPFRERLMLIQNDLFDVGADLCVPQCKPEKASDKESSKQLRMTEQQVLRLEKWIDEANKGLTELKSFVLPGGSLAAAMLHQARTVCRRSEIEVIRLANTEPINPQSIAYLNRLSDLLFVMARVCNDNGNSDVLWVPGKNRDET